MYLADKEMEKKLITIQNESEKFKGNIQRYDLNINAIHQKISLCLEKLTSLEFKKEFENYHQNECIAQLTHKKDHVEALLILLKRNDSNFEVQQFTIKSYIEFINNWN